MLKKLSERLKPNTVNSPNIPDPRGLDAKALAEQKADAAGEKWRKLAEVNGEKPVEVGIDPYNKLIDTNSDDNRKKVESL